LFAKQEVGLVDIAPGGFFFTGDGTGLLTVWKWLELGRVQGCSLLLSHNVNNVDCVIAC